MFAHPIKCSRLTSMEELLKFSFRTTLKATPLIKCQNNGVIAFVDKYGNVRITPYRTETHAILEEAGYKDCSFWVPFSNGEKLPDAYQWLKRIAEQENVAATCEEAFKIASQKGIKPVNIIGKYRIKEIFSSYHDIEAQSLYFPLTTVFLLNNSEENIGTFILVDEKTLVICDDYGRTFLLKAKTVVNDLVNTLIDAGYTRTAHPENYIRPFEKPAESDSDADQ